MLKKYVIPCGWSACFALGMVYGYHLLLRVRQVESYGMGEYCFWLGFVSGVLVTALGFMTLSSFVASLGRRSRSQEEQQG